MQMLMNSGFGGAEPLVRATFLAGLFLAILYKRHRILNLMLFRRSFVLFAASIAVPPCLAAAFAYFVMMTGGAPAGSTMPSPFVSSGLAAQIFLASGHVLFALSILYAMAALVPRFLPPHEASPPQRDTASSG